MTDRDAMLAACLDRPMDETPRLVLADWLDELDEDGSLLRGLGYFRFSSPFYFGPPNTLWWGLYDAAVVRLGDVPDDLVPRCVGRRADRRCPSRSRGFYFGEWRCLHCAAAFATFYAVSIGNWVKGERPIAWVHDQFVDRIIDGFAIPANLVGATA